MFGKLIHDSEVFILFIHMYFRKEITNLVIDTFRYINTSEMSKRQPMDKDGQNYSPIQNCKLN